MAKNREKLDKSIKFWQICQKSKFSTRWLRRFVNWVQLNTYKKLRKFSQPPAYRKINRIPIVFFSLIFIRLFCPLTFQFSLFRLFSNVALPKLRFSFSSATFQDFDVVICDEVRFVFVVVCWVLKNAGLLFSSCGFLGCDLVDSRVMAGLYFDFFNSANLLALVL